ncbi:MAG: glycosyltransferase, partial [Ignavibacteriae bacterium]|nr:glycosyltransferase [Ignavibacteriota bacterium]
MDLSVIIVNYNVRQFLENSLTSIFRAMEGLTGEVFVIDNASDDGSLEMVRAKFPQVQLIENKVNVGFAKANNAALKRAQGRFILLINPDTVVQEDTFRVMLSFFDENPDAGLAGCKVLNPDGSFQLPCRRSFPTPWVAFTKITGLSGLFPSSKLFGKYNLTYLSEDETYEVDAVSGSYMFLRREVYQKIGGLDETFFMYGEDLDWCYRVSRSGYKVYYVHSTKIIHFKGESTRRSDIDEIRTFYQAMQLFVEKHFSNSFIVELFLSIAIVLRAALAVVSKASRPLLIALMDFILVDLALIISEYLHFGVFFRFPHSSYPIVWTIPALVVVTSLYSAGVYTSHRHSVSRTFVSVIISYTILSATIFFAKSFAWSRAVVLISGAIIFLILPGWRLLYEVFTGRKTSSRKSLFGRPTVIVGTGPSAQEVLKKLRARVDHGYDIVGFIDLHRRNIGERIAGIEIIGSIDNVGKVINERKVSEVIFSTDGLSYADILSVIARSRDRSVNFRLVPNSLEAIIGKTRIDELDALPLVEIEYNIHRAGNRLVKRVFDILLSTLGMVFLYPWVFLGRMRSRAPRRFGRTVLLLPHVFLGRISLVGRPLSEPLDIVDNSDSILGPRGLTGLVQINHRDDLDVEEAERYTLYYAKNQSLLL